MMQVFKLNNSLNSIRLVLKLGEVKDLRRKGGIIGDYIANALDENMPACQLLPWIKQQAENNPTMMGTIIGEELTLEILKL